MNEEYKHIPVLKDEIIKNISNIKNSIIIDATIGGFGHIKSIIDKYKNTFKYIGLDYDSKSLNYFSKKNSKIIKEYDIKLYNINFANIDTINFEGIISNIIFDLGISSYQLDNPKYGLSFKKKSILDMRVNKESNLTALDIIKTYSIKDLKKILDEYVQEKFSYKIANAIQKEKQKIKTTADLAMLIEKTVPNYSRKRHPAFKTFTALRMEVNQEIKNLKVGLYKSISILAKKGRLFVITFNSTEDTIVKNIFKELENPCICPKNLPCVCGKKPLIKIITKKAITPTNKEIKLNPRSRSAKLRIIEKL